jgi:hypothetical protein
MNEDQKKKIEIIMVRRLQALSKAHDKVYKIQLHCHKIKSYMTEDEWDDFCFKYLKHSADISDLMIDTYRI